MSKDNGGPAFARPYGGHPDPAMNDPEMQAQDGMSLRDYFAAQAMTGLMGRSWAPLTGDDLVRQWAISAYAMADAMLVARSA